MLAALNHRAQQLDARKQLYLMRVLEKLERAQQVCVCACVSCSRLLSLRLLSPFHHQ